MVAWQDRVSAGAYLDRDVVDRHVGAGDEPVVVEQEVKRAPLQTAGAIGTAADDIDHGRGNVIQHVADV